MQLYSVEQKRSQALEAHAAAFSTLKVRRATMLPAWVLGAHGGARQLQVSPSQDISDQSTAVALLSLTARVCCCAAEWQHSDQLCAEDLCPGDPHLEAACHRARSTTR